MEAARKRSIQAQEREAKKNKNSVSHLHYNYLEKCIGQETKAIVVFLQQEVGWVWQGKGKRRRQCSPGRRSPHSCMAVNYIHSTVFLLPCLPHIMFLFQDYNPGECPVCYDAFDDTEHRPHSLPCGHTLCTQCLKKLIKQKQVTCPECRICNKVPKGGMFPVTFAMEDLIRRLRDVEAAAAAATPPTNDGKGKGNTESPCPKTWLRLSKSTRTFLQEQEAKVVAAITTCHEVHSQLDQYQTALVDWQDHHQQLQENLLRVVQQSNSARELMQLEEAHAVTRKMETKEREQQLQALLETMHTITSEEEIGAVVTEVVRCLGQAEQVELECQENSPNVRTATTVKKVSGPPGLWAISHKNRQDR